VSELVEFIEDPCLETLQDHAVRTLDLPVRPGVHHGYPIHVDMVICNTLKFALFKIDGK
jgi:hypothetical protein